MDVFRNQGLKSAIYGTLVVAMGVVFVIQFRPGGPGKGGGVKTDCIAEVRGECVSARDFRATMALAAPRIDEAQAKQIQLRKRVVDGLVERSLLVQDAERLGVGISDDDLNAQLTAGHALLSLGVETSPLVLNNLRLPMDRTMRLLEVKNPNGQFDKKSYEKALRLYVGRGPAEFREMQRLENLAARMREVVKARVRLSDGEALQVFEREKTTYSVRFVKIERPWLARFVIPHDKAAIDAFLESHKAQVDSSWESRKAQYLPECRRARHILVKASHAATDDEKAAAKKKIEAAAERIKKGEAFEAVARELSEDTSAEDGGELGCVAKGKMVKPFEEATFSLKAGELSSVVETEYGYHIIKLDGIYAGAEAETQGRRDVARDLLLSIESETRAAELGKRILAAAQGGKSLEDAVKETLAAAIPAPVEKKDKKGDRKPEKKGDKKGDETADEKKEARGPLDQPDAPHVEVANDVSPEGAGPLPGVEIPAQVSPLKKPGDLVPDLIKLEAGYAVLQLIERKAPSKEAFEKERVRFTQALLAAKQHDALFAYVQRLREVAKNDIKVNAAYLTDKAPAEEPSE